MARPLYSDAEWSVVLERFDYQHPTLGRVSIKATDVICSVFGARLGDVIVCQIGQTGTREHNLCTTQRSEVEFLRHVDMVLDIVGWCNVPFRGKENITKHITECAKCSRGSQFAVDRISRDSD